MEFQLPPSHEGERSAPLSASSRKNFNSRPFQGKLRGPSGQPARQLNLTASAQGRSGENFAACQTASVPTAPAAPAQGHFRGNFTGMSDCPPVSPTPPHPRRAAPGKTSQAQKPRRSRRPQGHAPSDDTTLADPSNHSGQTSRPIRTARPSAQPHRIRAGPLRGKLRGPSDCLCTNRPYCTRAGPFQGKFHRHVRRPARQLSSTASAQGCSGKNFISPKTTAQQTASRPRPVRRRNARHPSNHSGQTSRPGRRRNDHSSARPPRPNFLRTKAPVRRSPVQI